MSRACVLLAAGFEELEAITIIDVLRRGEIDVTSLKVDDTEHDLTVTGAHGVPVVADRLLSSATDELWDLVVLPGGLPGATNLRDNSAVRSLVKSQHEAGRRIGAICAAPIALGAAGVLQGKRATSYPGFEGELTGATCVEDRVVHDGNVVTSRGPGTALAFALALVQDLRGDEVATALKQGMLVTA